MRKILISLSLLLMALSSNLFAQEITPGKEVDLGLPSGTIWAGWNVGASSPEEYGGYYAWGEVVVKRNYSTKTYKYYNKRTKKNIEIGENISGTKYDVARQKWGNSWRMPTKEEFEELDSECSWEWGEYKGVIGQKITGPNGNSIFLPAAGRQAGVKRDLIGKFGTYWSASVCDWGEDCSNHYAVCFDIGDGYTEFLGVVSFDEESGMNVATRNRDWGFPIRPVKSK